MTTPRIQPRPEWAEHIRRLVEQAPPLTPAQIDKLAVLLQAPKPSHNPPPRRTEDRDAVA